MPAFCRHGRFESSCAICRREQEQAKPAARPASSTSRRPGTTPRRTGAATSSTPRRGSLVTGKLTRSADDGFRSELLPGVRATADVEALARELSLAEQRLAAIGAGAGPWESLPALAGEPERAFVQALLLVVASPDVEAGSMATTAGALAKAPEPAELLAALLDDAPPAELAQLLDEGPRGPRAHDAAATALSVPRQLAQRHGSLAAAVGGDASWDEERRFARILDRLALRGLPRAVRYDLLTALGRTRALPVTPGGLHLGSDQVTDAAKRLFAVADVPLLERRAAALIDVTGVRWDALELALWNLAGADAAAGGAAARWSKMQRPADRGLPAEADVAEVELLSETIASA